MRDFVLKLSERIREMVAPRRPRGQSLVIVAGAFIGLAVMVGLAIDGGILFVSQAHLRRAVDAAAVAAATQMRVGQLPDAIQRYAYQFIKMNGVDPNTVLVSFYNYNNDPSGAMGQMTIDCHHQDSDHIDTNYDKYGLCYVPQRKLIRVEARATAQFAFMPLVGIISTTVTASAVSESASVDAVIVMDTSMSMGGQTDAGSGPKQVSSPADVAACNAVALTDPKNPVGNCRPLMDAKEAAKVFVRRLYPDYDRVAILNFDFKAHPVTITDTKPQVETTSNMFSYVRGIRNPDPDGLNQGSGLCSDPNAPPNYHGECDDDPNLPGSQSTGLYRAIDSVTLNTDRYPWNDPDPTYNSILANDWGPQGAYGGQWNPLDYTCNWFNWPSGSCPGHPSTTRGTPEPHGLYSALSTCTGCGIRVAGNMLKLTGRPSALWIIVFLSDGGVNVSDIPDTTVAGNPILDAGIKANQYPNGYCGVPTTTVTVTVPGGVSLWKLGPADQYCVGKTFTDTRQCGPYNEGLSTCAPGAAWAGYSTPPYDALDYARDMIDATALRIVCVAGPGEDCLANNGGPANDPYNKNEHPRGATGPAGANLTIYSIGLGSYVAKTGTPVNSAESLLRYMAAVGDDGDRATDPCVGVPSATNCGNYYYAAKGVALTSIFEDIAKRVFTRLSK